MKSTLSLIVLVLLIYLTHQGSFPCNVQNCQYCSYPNFCGQCLPNNLLTWNNATNTFSCVQLTCPFNCQTCYINYQCQVCANGYFLTSVGTCSWFQTSAANLSINCLWGTSSQNCTVCAYGYSLQAGFCYPIFLTPPNFRNCLIQQAPMICQICQPSYFVGPLGNCIPMSQINETNCNAANCAYCSNAVSNNTNNTCTICMPGFQLTYQGTCTNNICNITGCTACGIYYQCTACSIGYIYNQQTGSCMAVGYGCGDPNCLICDGPQSCGQCKGGFTNDNYLLSGGVVVKICHPLVCPYNVTNCARCSYQYTSLFNFRTVLCSLCNPGFSLVNGYCVAQLSQTAYACNAQPNCASCSYNNFCSTCNLGYVLTTLGTCLPTQCQIPNCASCSANFVCQACNPGFTLSLGFLSYTNIPISDFVTNLLNSQCIPSSISCQIANCAYCTANNTCALCTSGYDFTSSNVCSPTCTVANCLQCSEGFYLYCLACKPGYSLSSNNQSCTAISYSCLGCLNYNTTCFYNWVTQQGSCTQCSSGMLLFQGQCYSSRCNIYGCNQCSTWVNPPVCLRCNQGLILSNGYCQQLNCNNNVANCTLCIDTGACLGCAQGFLLVNKSGTTSCVAQNSTCQDPNCIQCSADGYVCEKCAMPYNVSNGICVCGFQNCLQCSTSGITCDTCPYPLFASFSTQGCSPAPSLKLTCGILNCRLCLTPTMCSICAIGYTLSPSTYQCVYNNCTLLGLSNCSICDSFGYLCHQCNVGFMPSDVQQGGQCMPINPGYTCNISGCAICNSVNNSICANCLPGYFSNGSTQCIPNSCNIQNCYMCLQNNICYQCISGFYLTINNGQQTCTMTRGNLTSCQGQIANCAVCVINFIDSPNTANQVYCVQCNNGFEFDTTNIACIPQSNSIPHCKVQANLGYYTPPICLVCEQGYYINSWNTCKQYNPATNNTNCSVYNCLYCGVNSTICSFCFVPWGISQIGVCQTNINCSANCLFCTNATNCITCNIGYKLNPPNTCVACNIANCQLCLQPNVCVACSNGFSLTGSNTCLTCNVPGCLNCSNPNICATCGNSATGVPQTPSPTGAACYPCNLTLSGLVNCISCSNANSCGLCQNGYQLYTPAGFAGTCIFCNIPNCQTCAVSGAFVVCQTCAIGYSQNNGFCVQCLYPCLTCNSNPGPNNCASCQSPFYFSAALPNGTCLPNLIPNCVNYNPSNLTQCTTCANFFTLNSDSNICQFNCPNSCQICSSPILCTQCVQGYYLASNGSCIQCQVTGCLSCSSDGETCNQCFAGFYLISDECRVCPGYCSTCTSSSSCNALVSSTQQVLVLVGQSIVLAICQQNCITCSNLNPQVCLKCVNGFYLSNGNCFQCSSNCMSCSSTVQDQCFSCYPNNFLSVAVCSTCSSTCLTCQSPTQPNVCTSCNSGFYLTNSTCVQGCSLNCFTCSSPSICTQCLSGYTLYEQSNQTICVPCTTSCRTCANGQPAACLSCGIGFFLAGTTCIQCSSNCNTCTATGCISCISGYFLTSTQSCSPNCALPCATCSAVTPTKCTGCIAGYNYNDQANTCTPINTCTGACQVCPLGYSLNIGKCIQCTASQCQACNPNSPSQCYSCLPGFFLNPSSNQCQACPSNCQTCLSSLGCTTCASGYTTIQNTPLTSSGYQCVACNSPCATCVNTPNYCTSCVTGYQFIGWKCSQSFYFGFQVTLLTTIGIFNQNYYNFLLALSTTISATTPNAITIASITPGSVVVVGGAGPSAFSGTKQANQQFSALQSALSSNGFIANMPIGESSVVVIGGSVDFQQINLALILGICIPVGVLLIAGIVIYIYCKKKHSSKVIEAKLKEDSGLEIRKDFEIQLSSHYSDASYRRTFGNDSIIGVKLDRKDWIADE